MVGGEAARRPPASGTALGSTIANNRAGAVKARQDRRLETLGRLLTIGSLDLRDALTEAADALAETFEVEKIDVFLHDPSREVLAAVGTSTTTLGQKQKQLGLDVLPIANKGRTVEVYETGEPYLSGSADEDPGELIGIREALGVRSTIAVPVAVQEQRRGVLLITTTQSNAFSSPDLQFARTVGQWMGALVQRIELSRQVTDLVRAGERRRTAEEMVTILAHDLGNLLVPLKGYLSLMARRAERDARERDMREMSQARQSVDRLQRLVKELLDIRRLQHGVFDLTPEAVDLAELARETVGTYAGARAEVAVEAEEPVWCRADPSRVRQVLENLIGNALKFSPEGGTVRVTVGKTADEESGEAGTISVADEGPGVPAELAPHIFEPFWSGTGKTSGLGIGLYLANGVAEAHGEACGWNQASSTARYSRCACRSATRPSC